MGEGHGAVAELLGVHPVMLVQPATRRRLHRLQHVQHAVLAVSVRLELPPAHCVVLVDGAAAGLPIARCVLQDPQIAPQKLRMETEHRMLLSEVWKDEEEERRVEEEKRRLEQERVEAIERMKREQEERIRRKREKKRRGQRNDSDDESGRSDIDTDDDGNNDHHSAARKSKRTSPSNTDNISGDDPETLLRSAFGSLPGADEDTNNSNKQCIITN